MKKLSDLNLQPGETVFVDSLHDGIARLVIGEEGTRIENVEATQLPEECRKAGIHLCRTPEGGLEQSPEHEKDTEEETGALMEDVFGGPPPE